MADFVHLHVHSEYSLLDGLPKMKNLLGRIKELGMDACAITDHGAMYGAIEFYKKAREIGIKPIVGIEAYTTLLDHKSRPERAKAQNNHLLLLAKNEEGYKNLMEITTIAHLEGYYYKPRITRTLLEKYSNGLICTSSCPLGEVAQNLIANDYEKAKEVAKWFQQVFGDDYYLEVQRHEHHKYLPMAKEADVIADLKKMQSYEKIINDGVLKLSRDLGIPIVATNDSHYINQEDAEAQDALVCVSTGKLVSDTKRIRFKDNQSFYVKSQEEMKDLFPDMPDAISNTVKIAEKCNLEISTLGKWFFPKFDVPGGKDESEYLRELVYERLPERFPDPDDEIKKRMEHELEIIINKGYAPYFLIVMDMVNWANSMGIITNTRGSAAGSIVSYILGITTVDPIKYYLPFERFLNPFRPSPPDIDFDVSDNRREEIIEYIVQKYGRDRVAQICTFGRMLARAAVRDVARVLGYPYITGDRISKMIPPPKQGFPIDIPKALSTTPQLTQVYNADADAKRILDLAHHVEGSARHLSVHAAGTVVAPTKLTEFTPLQFEPKGSKVITQYEMHACEDVGLIKFDILGIRNLSILGAAIQLVKDSLNIDIDLHKLPIDDKKTFDMLAKGETMGVFQLSSSGMTRYLKDLQPNRIEDLMAMVALYRPGPMSVIPEYIERKRNPKKVKYLDPRMEKFLGASYGLIVYQDDLLFCALDLAGYTWEEADKFRKAVGKKIPEEMAAQKEKFMAGIKTNGQTQEFAENLWKLFEPFQSYGFNKAHAASYGMVAYFTAYMKANYTVEYMCALLTAESGDTEKISTAINECRRMGIKVLPPDVNQSGTGFTIVENKDSLDGKAIRFGLSAIKNVGSAAIDAILETRKDGNFVSFADCLVRVDGRRVNKKVLESLIKVGAFEKFGTRAALLKSMDDIKAKITPHSKQAKGQQGLFGEEEEKSEVEFQSSEFISDTEEFGQDELQSLERQLLGFSLSARPITELLGPLEYSTTHKISDIGNESTVDEQVKLAVVITEIRVVVTKKTGQEMAFVKVEDGTGSMNLVVFPRLFESTRESWVDYKPLLVTGKIDIREDSPSLIVESIETKESSTKVGNVFIKIPKTINTDQLQELKKLLLGNLGNQPVTLIFQGKKTKMDLDFKINWNEDLARKIGLILEPVGA